MHYRPITRFTTTAFAGIIVLVALSAFIGSAVHADRGYECFHCHTLLFKFRKGTARIPYEAHDGDTSCFSCHNGSDAFPPPGNCERCHGK